MASGQDVEWIVSVDPDLVVRQALVYANYHYSTLVAGGLAEREACVNAYAAVAPMLVPVMLRSCLQRLDGIEERLSRVEQELARVLLRMR